MESVSKKLKVDDNCSEPFTQKGSQDDEVTLAFEKKKLYVSKNFLCLASPVFEAMFRNEFREKKDKTVAMTGKSYEDFLDFLLCINPRYLKEVNELNVLRIVPLADEYQVTAIVTKCKAVMMSMLSNAEKIASAYTNWSTNQEPLKKCLTVLKSATSLNYTDIIDLAVKSIARFGYGLYNGFDHPRFGSKMSNPYRDCDDLFKSISFEIRYKILSERLMKVNDNNFK